MATQPMNLTAENLQAWRESMAHMADRLAAYTNPRQDPERRQALTQLRDALRAPLSLEGPDALSKAYSEAAQQAQELKSRREAYTPSNNTRGELGRADNQLAERTAALTGVARPQLGDQRALQSAYDKALADGERIATAARRVSGYLPDEQKAEIRAAADALKVRPTVTPESVEAMRAAQQKLASTLEERTKAMPEGFAKSRAEDLLARSTVLATGTLHARATPSAPEMAGYVKQDIAPTKPAPELDLASARAQAQRTADALASLSDRLQRDDNLRLTPQHKELKEFAVKLGESARDRVPEHADRAQLDKLAKEHAAAYDKLSAVAKEYANDTAPGLKSALRNADNAIKQDVLVMHERTPASERAPASAEAAKAEAAKTEAAKAEAQSAAAESAAPKGRRGKGENAEVREQRQQYEAAAQAASAAVPSIEPLAQRVDQLVGEIRQLDERARVMERGVEDGSRREDQRFAEVLQTGERYGKALTEFEGAQKKYEEARWNAMYSEGGGAGGFQSEFEAERKMLEAKRVLEAASEQKTLAEQRYNSERDNNSVYKQQYTEVRETRDAKAAELGESRARLSEAAEGLKRPAEQMAAASERLTELNKKHDGAPLHAATQALEQANETLQRSGPAFARESGAHERSEAVSDARSAGRAEAGRDTAASSEVAKAVSMAETAAHSNTQSTRAARPTFDPGSWADKIDRSSDWGPAPTGENGRGNRDAGRLDDLANQVARLRGELLSGDPNRVLDPNTGMTALMAANRMGMQDVAKELQARGADPAALDKAGRSAADYAHGAHAELRRSGDQLVSQTTELLREQASGGLRAAGLMASPTQQAQAMTESLHSQHQQGFADTFNLEAMRARISNISNPLDQELANAGRGKSEVTRPAAEKEREAPQQQERGR